MTPRTLLSAVAVSLALALALLAACGGDGQPEGTGGQITDPSIVPTASPWIEPPEVTFLPDALTAVAEGQEEEQETPTTQVTPTDCGDTYTVQPGDYPGLIAEKCGVTAQDLLAANPSVEPTNLHVGDVLKIP